MRQSGSFPDRGSFGDPSDISLFTGWNGNGKSVAVFHDRSASAWISPSPDFRMPVGKSEPAGAGVIRSRQVTPLRTFTRIASGAVNKPPIVDAIGVFVQKNKYVGGFPKVGQLDELLPLAVDR